jgi:hypothetical protein
MKRAPGQAVGFLAEEDPEYRAFVSFGNWSLFFRKALKV